MSADDAIKTIDNIFLPTVRLCFTQRDGKEVLQQLWHNRVGDTEWRDVPIDDEGARPALVPARTIHDSDIRAVVEARLDGFHIGDGSKSAFKDACDNITTGVMEILNDFLKK